jgi:para-aminobenzoate synthetase/4-amino-4-deoxychorismate lyase
VQEFARRGTDRRRPVATPRAGSGIIGGRSPGAAANAPGSRPGPFTSVPTFPESTQQASPRAAFSLPPSTREFRPVRDRLEGDLAPDRAAALVRDDPQPFVLAGRWAGGATIAGSAPVWTAPPDADPFALLGSHACVETAPPGFVGGGWFGYLGFGLAGTLEAHGAPPPTRHRLPPFALAWFDHVVRRDEDGRWWFEALWTPERDAELQARRELLAARLAAGAGPPRPVRTSPFTATPSPDGHGRAVSACRVRIAEGDLYQANLALRLSATLSGEPIDLFGRALESLAPDRAAFMAGEWGAIASLSPELFLERRGTTVRSAPIKGTRRRLADPDTAKRAHDDLARSTKDRAENVMIVDLIRNDLGQVCRFGTVRVPALAEPRRHPGVWHLVSEVVGELEPGVDDGRLVRAMFPPGSVTGAPKLAAVDVIHELESSARQLFSGAVGFASPCAGLELNVAIRTFEMSGTDVWLDVGGGIVADSDPVAEAAEALDKAAPLLTAIGATITPAAGSGRAPLTLRMHARPIPRPDPRAGLLETILVTSGRAPALDEHLTRLAAGMRAVYGAPVDPGLRDRIREEAARLRHGRLRVLARPGMKAKIQAGPIPPSPPPKELVPVTVPGGIGEHKWLDRRLLDALADAAAPGAPLLVDLDGHVLETATAAVLFATGTGTLVVPPLDGRILPSITRARALVRARDAGVPIHERPVRLAELDGFAEVLLASSLRGVRPVGDGGELAALLGDVAGGRAAAPASAPR